MQVVTLKPFIPAEEREGQVAVMAAPSACLTLSPLPIHWPYNYNNAMITPFYTCQDRGSKRSRHLPSAHQECRSETCSQLSARARGVPRCKGGTAPEPLGGCVECP